MISDRQYISSNENFEYAYPRSNAFRQSRLRLEGCKPHIATRQPRKCDQINEVKLFLTVNCRI